MKTYGRRISQDRRECEHKRAAYCLQSDCLPRVVIEVRNLFLDLDFDLDLERDFETQVKGKGMAR